EISRHSSLLLHSTSPSISLLTACDQPRALYGGCPTSTRLAMSEAENYPRPLEPQTAQGDAKPGEKERPKTSFIELVKKYGLPNEGNMDAYSQWASEQFGTPGQPTKKLTIEQVRKCYEIIANAK